MPVRQVRMTANVQRVGVLFSRLSGYMAACLRALKEQYGVALLVIRKPPVQDAPFEGRHFEWIDALYDRDTVEKEDMQTLVTQFEPDALLMSGWVDRTYLQVARRLRKNNVPVIAGSDTQWQGSFRQRLGQLLAPWYLQPAVDVLWVAGERQRQLAARLGYTGERCWSGIYACDWQPFADVYSAAPVRPHAFLYVGRYVAVKGIDMLVEAYRRYRTMVAQPWPLLCAGAGAHQALLAGQEGIVDKGFVQPDDLPGLMSQASASVLPSQREPWGVVVQEAAATGLPLLCSDACGAAVHLLQDGYNGFLFEAGNAQHLARCMARMTEASRDEWEAMSRRSHQLSKQYTPQRWADTFVQGVAALRMKTS